MRVRIGHCLFVVCYVALVLASSARAEYEWSGFVNTFTGDVSYLCPDDFAVSGVASTFSDAQDDRRWEYRCSSGGGLANVTLNCTLQDPINSLTGDIGYDCPDSGYIAGFQSEFTSSQSDRVWRPHCCTRPYASLVNCEIPNTDWENLLEEVLNWTASNTRVLTGLQSFYSPFNRDRRWRFRQCEIQVSCGDPGTPANAMREGDSFLFGDEVVFTCNHGYYQSSGPEGGVRRCQDTGLWSDSQPVCTRCTDIENCADVRCTSAIDQTCFECVSDNGLALGEAAYRNLNTSCLPLCSWLRAFCYPGVCPDEPFSCNCSEGFTGEDCLTITAQPDLDMCTTVVHYSTSSVGTGSCSINSTSIIYINSAPTSLEASWLTMFAGPSPLPVPPAYVDGFAVGVASTAVFGKLYRATSYPTQPVTVTRHNCGMTLSADAPRMDLISCPVTANAESLSNHTFLHGDRFEVEVVSVGGGFLDVTDLDSNETMRHYYAGSEVSGSALYIIDTEQPTHCSVEMSTTCLANQDVLRATLDSNVGRVTLVWGGWIDIPSGVTEFRVEVSRLQYDSAMGVLRERLPLETTRMQLHTGQQSYTEIVPLNEEGPYSIVLVTTDAAGNSQYARRIVRYDVSSRLMEDESKPLVAVSGVAEGNAYWHNSTSSPIIISGQGHFFNLNQTAEDWLAPVANHTSSVPPEFDDEARRGTPNALGVVEMSFAVLVDQEGGQGVTRPASFPNNTADLALESVAIMLSNVADGDSVTIWFQARDFQFTFADEPVLVHIDSSPPVISDLGLVVNGVGGQVLHGTGDLLDLNIEFQAADVHSGLYSIEWSIRTDTGDVGNGNVPVTTFARDVCLLDPDCLCDTLNHCHKRNHTVPLFSANFSSGSQAQHDTDYYITITAVNNARLSSSTTLKITVDLTPPLVGAVMEGLPQQTEVDYQQQDNVTIHWGGFFDRETAIPFYQYIVATECVGMDSFQYPLTSTSPAQQTTSNMIMWNAPSPGTYYATVVAYNGALQPSQLVCSDGVTVDKQPPVFGGVVIPGGVVREGLVQSEGEVWVLYANRERALVTPATEECVLKSANFTISELAAFPIRYNGSSPAAVPSSVCSQLSPFSSLSYTSVNTVLNITWTATDNVGIRSYQLGLSTSPNTTGSLDILPLQNTAGHTHFSAHSSDLVSGAQFYVVVMATDLAMHVTRAVVGPVVIDTSPPQLNGSLFIEQQQNLVMVWWVDSTFVDEEDLAPLDTVTYAIGSHQYGSDILGFTPLPSSPHPSCPSSNCITMDTHTLGLLPGSQYHVSVRVKNSAGLESTFPVGPFLQQFPLPSCLSVFEAELTPFPPNTTSPGFLPQQEDVDIILGGGVFAGWTGLQDDHLNVSFSVAMGTRPGWSDVAPFVNVGSHHSHSFSNLSLNPGTQYYITVRASNSLSQFSSTSDGFLALTAYTSGAFVWDGLSNDRDSDHLASSSEVSARWFFPSPLVTYITHYRWALVQAVDGNRSNLVEVLPYTNTGRRNSIIMPVQLRQGVVYVSAVQACLQRSCLPPVLSDGFQLALPPVAGSVIASYQPLMVDSTTGVSARGLLNASWSSFSDAELSHYQWAVITGGIAGNALVTEWAEVQSDTQQVTAFLERPLSLHVSHWVVVRAFNRAGLQASAVASLLITDTEVSRLVVYDVAGESVPPSTNGDWRQLEHHAHNYADLEYTRSPHSLSAAWPMLRYTQYNYSISLVRTFQPCAGPGLLSCGSTITNALTVSNLSLVNGQRYYFCVRALAEDSISFSSAATTVTACSNGVTVDLSPPQVGCVQILPPPLPSTLNELSSGDEAGGTLSPNQAQSCLNQSGYQASTSVVHIVWDWFVDSEQNGNVPDAHGVSFYQYAIGTSPGGEDVVSFTSVGVAREAVVTGLNLTPGLTYYATVKAVDHVGLWSTSTSQGVTVDSSPPTINRLWLITPTSYAATLLSQLQGHWDLVLDEESGVTDLYWSLGSVSGQSDLIRWRKLNVTETSVTHSAQLDIPDGQPIVLTLMAINGAGLSVVSSSRQLIYDSTPPCPGRVFDGPKPEQGFQDSDYSSDYTLMQAHWEPFSDPETGTVEYHWGVGTCPNCTDVMPFTSVGLTTEASRVLPLAAGIRYFVTVRGCSSYSGCSAAHSNGITIDPSPPIVSQLSHGLPSYPIKQFQASRLTIAAHWSGFHDPESDISHYTYYAGVAPDDDSYVPMTMVPAQQQYFIADTPFSEVTRLPVNRTVYVTVMAVNRAGLSTKLSSSGVFVTDLPPQVAVGVMVNVEWAGSLVPATQYVSSALRLEWQFRDEYTVVDRHYWSLVAEPGAGLPIGRQTNGTQTHASLTNLRLSAGGVYSVAMIGCNPASLCVPSSSSSILVDPSPPTDGYFAVQTNTAASLPWAVSDGMAWRNNPSTSRALLNITFAGFEDPHSRITSYWAIVGSSFRGKDLYESTAPLAQQEHSNPLVSIATVSLSRLLVSSETIYVSLWAVNAAGLGSHVVQGSFVVEEEVNETERGQLRLLRSSQCQIDGCRGHCTCRRRQLCEVPVDMAASCYKLNESALSPDMVLSVANSAPQVSSPSPSIPLFTAVTDQLVGTVTYETVSTAQWVEWSVGLQGADPGSGVIDTASDPVWFPLGPNNRAIFPVSPSRPLQDGSTYVFYARAWYNSTHYAVFQSAGVTVDSQGVEVVQGRRVRETSAMAPFEADFISSLSELSVKWNGVFSKGLPAQYARYEVGVGDSPGSDSAHRFTLVGTDTSSVLTGLSLQDNRKYYTTVRAISQVGVVTTSVSDGFLTDTTSPNVGVVTDGLWYWDEAGQVHTTSASLRHFGFHDPQSHIHHYEGAITASPNPPASSEFTDVGIRLKTTLTNLTLSSGTKYYSHVAAVNMAGVRSGAATSNGFTVDNSPPVALRCQSFSHNLLQNGSFESVPCHPSVSVSAVEGWESSSRLQLIGMNTHAAYSGCHSLRLSTPIQQTFLSTTGQTYSLSFAMRGISDAANSLTQARVVAAGSIRVFTIYSAGQDDYWQLFELPFNSSSSSTTITIAPVGGDVAVDDVQVTRCTDFVDTDNFPPLRSRQDPIFIPSTVAEVFSSWWLRDEESGAEEFMWALGTVPGGEQLQHYSATGGNSWATSTQLAFSHNTTVYVSLVGKNGASRSTHVFSEPLRVDTTPPVLQGALKEGGGVEDIDYQNTGVVQLDWSAIVDEESGIKECYWAIGRTPGADDIQPFSAAVGQTGNSADISSLVTHDTKLYSTVTCSNNAGRSTTAVSDGVTFLSSPPSSVLALLNITSTTPTLYEPRDGYLPSNSFLVSWSGFLDASGEPLRYQLRLVAEGTSLGPEEAWTEVGDLKQLAIDNVTASEGMVEVRAYLMEGLTSSPAAKRFFISSSPPIDDDGVSLSVNLVQGSVTIDWTGRFQAPAGVPPLFYEASLGTQMGSAAIRRWVLETEGTSIAFSDAQLTPLREYFLSLSAIAYSGHSLTVNFMISHNTAVLLG